MNVQNILNFLKVYERKIIDEKILLSNKVQETDSDVFERETEYLQGELTAISEIKQFIIDNYD